MDIFKNKIKALEEKILRGTIDYPYDGEIYLIEQILIYLGIENKDIYLDAKSEPKITVDDLKYSMHDYDNYDDNDDNDDDFNKCLSYIIVFLMIHVVLEKYYEDKKKMKKQIKENEEFYNHLLSIKHKITELETDIKDLNPERVESLFLLGDKNKIEEFIIKEWGAADIIIPLKGSIKNYYEFNVSTLDKENSLLILKHIQVLNNSLQFLIDTYSGLISSFPKPSGGSPTREILNFTIKNLVDIFNLYNKWEKIEEDERENITNHRVKFVATLLDAASIKRPGSKDIASLDAELPESDDFINKVRSANKNKCTYLFNSKADLNGFGFDFSVLDKNEVLNTASLLENRFRQIDIERGKIKSINLNKIGTII